MCGVKLRECGNQTENEEFERIRMCRNIWEIWSIRYNISWEKYPSMYFAYGKVDNTKMFGMNIVCKNIYDI